MNKKQSILVSICLVGLGVICWVASPWGGSSTPSEDGSTAMRSEQTQRPCPCGKNHSVSAHASAAKAHPVFQPSAKEQQTMGDFGQWLESFRKEKLSGKSLRDQIVSEGERLARARKSVMVKLIETDPEAALARSISWADYVALPAEVKAHVETPFSERGDFFVEPNCGSLAAGNPQPDSHRAILNNGTYQTKAFGRRLEHCTKENTLLQGIRLDGVAAVRAASLQRISAADVAAVRGSFVSANHDITRSFSSGRTIPNDPVVALGGGRLFYFANEDELRVANEKLSQLDRLPGPHTGAQSIFLHAAPAEEENEVFQSNSSDENQTIDWSEIENHAQLQASAWTETKKKVFFIRVDFPNNTGESISQSALDNRLNTTVSDMIEKMSYGKTWIDADVSSMVVRLPSPTTTYLPEGNDALHNDAIAAFNALTTGIDLGEYDIIGVHFKAIGMSSGGFNYGGLAGGSRQWLQGGSSTGLIVHEFGHNYGLGHASYWDTGGGSVIGAGSNDEYGNIFDVMGDGPDPEGHFHPQGKQHLNWLGSSDWLDANVGGSGTHRLYRIDHENTTGIRGLRVTQNAGSNRYYWIGYRRAITSNQYLQKGVVLNWQRTSSRSWLIDTTPGSAAGKEDSGVIIGQTYTDSGAGVHITPVAQGGTSPNEWVDVTVNIGSFSGNNAPTATLTGPSTGSARTDLVFSVSANDANGDTLAYSWDFGDGPVAHNQSQVTQRYAVGGTYSISVTVSDMKGGTVTKSMNVTITDPLTNWTQRTSGTTSDFKDIAFGDGKLVAVGNGRGTYRSSTNATSWSGGTLGINIRLDGVLYDGSQFIAVGYDYDFSISDWVGIIYTSPDGASWTQRHYGGEELHDIALGNGVLIVTGDAGTILSSTNGTSWSMVPSGVTTNLEAVSYGDGGFVIVGANNSSQGGTVLTSSNGSSWTNTSSNAGTSQGFFHLEFLNDHFLASGFYTRFRYSDDNGNSLTDTGSGNLRMRAMAYGNGVYFAAGSDYSNSNAQVNRLSLDGKLWSDLTTSATKNRNAAVFYQNTFITVGDDGEIWQSDPIPAPSGWETWRAQQFPGSPALSGAYEDFDGDGIDNLLEYIMGTDAKNGAVFAHPVLSVESGRLTLTVNKAAGVSGFTLTIEGSDDLVTWNAVGLSTVTDSASMLKVHVDQLINHPASTRKFLRAKAVLTP